MNRILSIGLFILRAVSFLDVNLGYAYKCKNAFKKK